MKRGSKIINPVFEYHKMDYWQYREFNSENVNSIKNFL